MKSLIVWTVATISFLVVFCIALVFLGADVFPANLIRVIVGAETAVKGRTRGARANSPSFDMIGDESQLSYEVKSSRLALLDV